MKMRLLTAAMLLAATAAPAHAASTITISGTFTNGFAGQSFTQPVTFTATSDADAPTLQSGFNTYLLNSPINAIANGADFQITEPGFYFYTDGTLAGVAQTGGNNLFTFNIQSGSTVFGSDRAFDSNVGPFTFISGEGITASLVSGAVPEPATWAMLILGLGTVGGVLRRRAATATASRMRLTYA